MLIFDLVSVTLTLEVGIIVLRMTHCLINVTICENPLIYKQEGHDGPEIAHLYIGPWANANFKPGTW
jgi:hypothetical protein